MFRLKARIRKFKSDRFLKKHGCTHYWQYKRRFDPDFNPRAIRVNDYFHGYTHVHCFTDRNHYAYEMIYDYGPGGCRDGYDDIIEWCDKHCKDKFRFDFLRVIQNYWGEWEVNEIGGGDYLFAAFKNQQDAIWFALKWA